MKKLFVTGIIGLCIWLTYQYPHSMLSPGELSEGHQKLNTTCNSCHRPFWGVDSKKCIACHALSEIGKDTLHVNDTVVGKPKVLFHQYFISQECTSCHTDHKGLKPDVRLNKFSHDLLPETERTNCNTCHAKPADAMHQSLSDVCGSCHNTAGWKSSVVFNHDMIQGTDKSKCVSCHKVPADDFHRQIAGECSSCHTTSKWKPSTFDHTKYFRFDNNHPETCTNCHTTKNYKSYTCYNCHEHSEGKIMNEHSEHGISNLNDCVRCHRSGNEHDTENGSFNQNENNSNQPESGKREGDKKHEGKGERDDD